MRTHEYTVIRSADLGNLITEVNEHIEHGWQMVGGIAVTSENMEYGSQYVQAIARRLPVPEHPKPSLLGEWKENLTGLRDLLLSLFPVPVPHKWSADGETCEVCGDKDTRADASCRGPSVGGAHGETPPKPVEGGDEGTVEGMAKVGRAMLPAFKGAAEARAAERAKVTGP